MSATSKPALSWWRVSTDQQEDFSPEAQREDNSKAAKRAGFSRVVQLGATERSTESVVTGGHRPAFESMLKRVQAGEFGAIFVTRFDRLTSNVIDAERTMIALQRSGTDLYEGGAQQDVRSLAKRLVATVTSGARGGEIAARTRNTIRTKITEAAKGHPAAGTLPFGRFPKHTMVGRSMVRELDASGCVVWDYDRDAKRYLARVCKLRLQGMSWARIIEVNGLCPGDVPSPKATPASLAKTLRERVTVDPSVTGVSRRPFPSTGCSRRTSTAWSIATA